MFIKKNELDALVSKVVQRHEELTYLTWGIRTGHSNDENHYDIVVKIFFKPNDDPKGSVIIERTIEELKNY